MKIHEALEFIDEMAADCDRAHDRDYDNSCSTSESFYKKLRERQAEDAARWAAFRTAIEEQKIIY